MANENMIQKHVDNFLAKIVGETPVDDKPRNSTEFWLNEIAENLPGEGTTVVANPETTGTEEDLTALQVGDTKYLIPSGGSESQIEIVIATGTTLPSDKNFSYIQDKILSGIPVVLVKKVDATHAQYFWLSKTGGDSVISGISSIASTSTLYIDTVMINSSNAITYKAWTITTQ